MPVLVVPGAFTRPSSFDRLAARLGAQVVARPARRVAQLDLGGLAALQRTLDEAIRAAPDDGTPLVLVGHSMGGLLILRAGLDHRFDAQVLLMPAPPQGLLADIARMTVTSPVNTARFLALSLSTVLSRWGGSPPRGLFTRDASPEVLAAAQRHRADESWSVQLELLFGSRARVVPAEIPTLVVGGTQDGLVPPARVRDLAQRLRAEHLELDVAHNFSEEPAGVVVEDAVEQWLRARSLLGPPPPRRRPPARRG